MDDFSKVKLNYIESIGYAIDHVIGTRFKGTQKLKVLDVGCGSFNSHIFSRYHKRMILHGYNLFQKDVCFEECFTKNAENRFIHDVEELDADYNIGVVFDTLSSIDIRKRKDILDLCFDRLKYDSILIVVEYNMRNSLTKKLVQSDSDELYAHTIEPKKMKYYLRCSDFEVSEKKYITFFPLKLWVPPSVDAFIGRVPFGAQYMMVAEKM